MKAQNSPRFHKGVVILPEVDGVQWVADDENVESGALPGLNPGETITVKAVLDEGVATSGVTEWTFSVPAEEATETVVSQASEDSFSRESTNDDE